MKNINPNVPNLFVHIISLIFRAKQIREELKLIGYDWELKSMKKDWKIMVCKSNIFHINAWILIKFLNLKHSPISIGQNPRAHWLEAAQKKHMQTWNFSRKLQIWKPSSRTIQGQIVVPLASWGFKESFPIKINHLNVLNW